MPKNKTVRTPTTAMKLDMDDKPEENGAEDQGDGSADQNGTKTSSKKDMLLSADSDRIVSANYDELFQKFIDQGADGETAEVLAKEQSMSGVHRRLPKDKASRLGTRKASARRTGEYKAG